MLQLLSQLQRLRISILPYVWQRSNQQLNQMLHEARRFFHDDNGIPDPEALKNIYQVVAQQLLNSRECYMKKHHNQKPVESPVKPGDLILMVNHIAKAFKLKYKKGTYRVVKVHGNQVDIQEEDPNKTTVTPAAPIEVEGPPSSCLRSKTKQQSTTIKQEQLECNPPSLDPPECNQAKLEVNQVEVDTGNRSSLVHYALTLLGVAKTISDQL